MTKPATTPSTPWPNIETFLDYGGYVSVGHTEPIGYTAIANDDHTMLAALVRRRGEALHDLLNRLDYAIDQALNHEVFTDEING